MNKINQLQRTKELLTQAMSAASNSIPNNRDVVEAKHYIRKAIENIEYASKNQIRKKENVKTQFDNWWGNIQSGVAKASSANEGHVKSLAALNAMISEEQKKLNELELEANKISEKPEDPQLLSD